MQEKKRILIPEDIDFIRYSSLLLENNNLKTSEKNRETLLNYGLPISANLPVLLLPMIDFDEVFFEKRKFQLIANFSWSGGNNSYLALSSDDNIYEVTSYNDGFVQHKIINTNLEKFLQLFLKTKNFFNYFRNKTLNEITIVPEEIKTKLNELKFFFKNIETEEVTALYWREVILELETTIFGDYIDGIAYDNNSKQEDRPVLGDELDLIDYDEDNPF